MYHDDRPPRFVRGRHSFSIAALRERIEAQIMAESGADFVHTLPTETDRQEAVREAAEYIIAVESLQMSRNDKSALIRAIYSDLFGFGPIDAYIEDPAITEIAISGIDQVFVRMDADEMRPAAATFDDSAQQTRIIEQILATVGAKLNEDDPILEIGVMLSGRPARLTLIMPPVSHSLTVNIRLHPTVPPTLTDLIVRGMLSEAEAETLRAALRAGRGVMIAGDVGTGKTTLLGALLADLPGHTIIVERAAELRVPPDMERLNGQDFAAQIESALAQHPPWLVLDEVRFDEGRALWTALTGPAAPHVLLALRGAIDVRRLWASFSMSLRRGDPKLDGAAIGAALIERLPVVALLAHQNGALKLIKLGEWVGGADVPELRAVVP